MARHANCPDLASTSAPGLDGRKESGEIASTLGRRGHPAAAGFRPCGQPRANHRPGTSIPSRNARQSSREDLS